MTVLQALNGYYERMARRGEVEAPGFSREKIGFAIELSVDGDVVDVLDLRTLSGKRLVPALLGVPAAVKRTVAISPNLFWDKSAYVLGRTAGEGRRTADEHAAFKAAHAALLAGANDPGLVALRRFLEGWTADRFDFPPFAADMLDANIVFRLKGDFAYIHDRDAARTLLAARETTQGPQAICLVTGRRAAIRRLHPSIKGVNGAQSAGASLVSFNLDAFTSYGKEQGDNAPTSEEAADHYGAALNRLLDRETLGNRIQIGDSTVVFWADASAVGEEAALAAEGFFHGFFEPAADADGNDDDAGEAAKIRDSFELVEKGRPVETLDPRLRPGTRFHILGLAPNAARLSVRFWMTGDFSVFARRLAEHSRDLAIEPVPWLKQRRRPSVRYLLCRTVALQEKAENVPPLLAGEVMRAVLSGSPYPRTLLAATITRLRAGDSPGSGWHAAVIKACINRSQEDKVPVGLDPDNASPAYQLGRLFALLESAQYAALGKVNAPIGDRYYGAASATPARVFGPLLRGLKNHLADARKRGRGGWIDQRIAEVMTKLPADLPRSLRLEDQGRFAVGYYHERAQRAVKDTEPEATHEDDKE
ncbi:type I-C CRISPR-associated protein Cas8c/Csd1 [Telmatospirillum sp.]|uniref:type I-C CRISPR-associated protein Cas8c/Csd1 n=1 Tax=Telmatospirillum sp. TaxID=2079197 RepID=UPI0028460486|nr:type I-C CRISPR-associated protein Cas8c/Csd1 [Telmatospirillum sp.]MDR3438857.1 type I-C CRISPR-associated protein Cas8c/Csd1 [Telmatospirillum sp.]